mgnify:CR=1 FL=1|jgi:hypothetical protein
MTMKFIQNFFKTFIIILISLIVGIIFCETILRIKHKYLVNYDIEMWKYAKELKQQVENKKINHVHKPDQSAVLQNVEIKINNHGQRNINYNNNDLLNFKRSFLVLGSSVALGWGVENQNTFVSYMNKKVENKNKNWIFVNGGVGNYNTERYINNYFENWSNLDFTDIIIHFFVNDTEVIKVTHTNFFYRNFHLGVVFWKLINSYKNEFNNENLTEYYFKLFEDNSPGFIVAQKELNKLKSHCDEKKMNCHLILMPDIHKLNPYNLSFINKKMSLISKEIGYSFLDLLPDFQNKDEKKLWNKYQDPHPNEYAHSIMGESIFNYLNK